VAIASDLEMTPAQLILSWVVQCGVVALTKSVTPSRIDENFKGKHPYLTHKTLPASRCKPGITVIF
jgi:diketogulonate reductase-like aldo/keto reductase